MEALLTVCLGIGLSAACGFRVFIPLLVMSIAANAGHLTLASGFEWIGSDTATVALAVATVLEIGAYYIPWLDNFLDSISTPAAIVAGVVVTASVVTDMSPLMKWSLAVIAGGGAAGAVQVVTVATRAASTVGTGGLANPMFATLELGGATFGSLLSFLAPVVAACGFLLAIALGAAWLARRRKVRLQPVRV